MSGLNKVMIIGRLGKDPEVKHLEGGSVVANFSVAVSEKYKNKSGETTETTEWINIVVWNTLAEIVEKYVVRGMLIYLEGKIKTRSYEKDSNKVYVTEVYANNLQMLSKTEHEKATVISESSSEHAEPAPNDANNGKVANGLEDLTI